MCDVLICVSVCGSTFTVCVSVERLDVCGEALAVLLIHTLFMGQGLWLTLEPACPGNPVSAS